METLSVSVVEGGAFICCGRCSEIFPNMVTAALLEAGSHPVTEKLSLYFPQEGRK